MRELDRHAAEHTRATPHPAEPGGFRTEAGPAGEPAPGALGLRSIAVVGRGRAGTALARALKDAGVTVHGPLGRGAHPRAPSPNGSSGAPDAVLLCVPDAEIPDAARAVAGGARLVGHASGATPLSALEPAARAGAELFGLHPLQTLTGEDGASRLAGSGCAIAGSTPGALRTSRELAERLGLEPFEIDDEHRPAYHAAASAASNFLVTLQDAAETVARGAGMAPADARRALLPLVRATVESWAALGPERALTGPVARGDEATVAAHRVAVERCDATLLPLFDAMVERTRHLAARGEREPVADAPGARSTAGERS